MLPLTYPLISEKEVIEYSTDFYKYSIEKDGNCLFHAIVHQLRRLNLGLEVTHSRLRQQAVEHIRANMPDYQEYINGDILHYLEDMAQNGAWGGEPEIRALAAVLEVRIHVLQPGNYQPEPYGNLGRPLLYLAYNGQNHYDSLIPRVEWENRQKSIEITNGNEGIREDVYITKRYAIRDGRHNTTALQ